MNRRVYRLGLLSAALGLFFTLGILGCDSGSLDRTGADEIVKYSYGVDDAGNEITVNALLHESLVQEHRTFAYMDEYHDALDVLEEEPVVEVNAALYRRLSNANTPAEISLLDNDGMVTIGAYRYSVTEEALYRTDSASSTDAHELIEYWGEDGLALAREWSQLIRARHAPEELAKMTFMNPAVTLEAEAIIAGRPAKTSTRNHNTSDEYQICAPDDEIVPGVTRVCYRIRFAMWNESTTRWLRRRAYAGTYVETRTGPNRWPPITHPSVPQATRIDIGLRTRIQVTADGGKGRVSKKCIPELKLGSLDYTKNPPYTSIGGDPCFDVLAIAKRKARRGATSEHGGGANDYFKKTWFLDEETWYLIHSESHAWFFAYFELD